MIDELLIGWKLASLEPDMASVRYRAMSPILSLEKWGVKARIFSVASPKNLDDLDCLVIVKSFERDDFYLVCEAENKNIPVIIDLCDNIFVDEDGMKTELSSMYFDLMAKYASLIVVST